MIHDSAAVAHYHVSGTNLHSGELNHDIGRLFHDPAAGGSHHRSPGIDRELDVHAVVEIAHGAIDYHGADTLHLGAIGENSAPAGGIQSPAIVDDDDVAALAGLDCLHAQMILAFVSPAAAIFTVTALPAILPAPSQRGRMP